VWGKAWASTEEQIATLCTGACGAQNFFDCRQQLGGCEGFLQPCCQLRPLWVCNFSRLEDPDIKTTGRLLPVDM
jgi:hypothetical protein